MSKAGAEGKYYQPSWDFYHVQGFCGSPVPAGTIHPHSHTDKAKERVCSGHSALGAQHPTLSLAGCYLCVTTKALLVTCLCPCSGAIRRTLGRTCPPAAKWVQRVVITLFSSATETGPQAQMSHISRLLHADGFSPILVMSCYSQG